MVGGNSMTASHAFAICAYGQSPYLRECIESVLNQQDDDGRPVRSEIFIATATPSAWLDGIASDYELAVIVNDGGHGIGQDWNFAYSQATADYVTITHQDDIYCPRYASAATSSYIEDNARANEDLELFRRFWPNPIAKLISRAYSSSEKSNDI